VKHHFIAIVFLLSGSSAALADGFSGTALPTPSLPSVVTGIPTITQNQVLGSAGVALGGGFSSILSGSPATGYATGSIQSLTTLPDTTYIHVPVVGYARDSSSPTGYSYITAQVPLDAFATSSSMQALQSQITSGIVDQRHFTGRAVAEAVAMAATGNIAADENFSLGANWGTFDGEHAIAAGGAMRLQDHITASGGISQSFGGGPVAAHAGFRIGS
jgi:hypothetical protein